MSEPIIQVPNGTGRGDDKVAEEQFKFWLDEMRPHLELANTLYRAMQKSGLLNHQTVIYEKYRVGDWFAQKVDTYRLLPAENVNEIYTRLIENINNKVKKDIPMTDQEVKILEHWTKTHRTAQIFFVNRTEVRTKEDDKDVGKVLDDIGSSDYGELGNRAAAALNSTNEPAPTGPAVEGQVVENNPPVQDSNQGGAAENVQPQPDPAPAPSPEGEPPVQPDPQG
jgi:hypothetical protein